MKSAKEFIAEFKLFGIAEWECKIYLALLEHGESSAYDLHRITGRARTKVYADLGRMVVHGLCVERQEGRNRFFRSIDPLTVFETLQHQWNTVYTEQTTRAEQTLKDLHNAFPLQQNSKILDTVEIIRNPAQIHKRFLALVNETQKEMLAFTRPPYAVSTEEEGAKQIEAQNNALDRGVHIRTIQAMIHIPDLKMYWDGLQENDELKVIDSLPAKMFIFDRKKVFAAVPSCNELDFGSIAMFVINDPGIAGLSVISFEHYWLQAKSHDEFVAERASLEKSGKLDKG